MCFHVIANDALGDDVFILLGCKVPVILRPRYSEVYELIGCCYLHGVMDGEALLGPLGFPWEMSIRNRSGNAQIAYYNVNAGKHRHTDPRLDKIPCPSLWEDISWNYSREGPNNCTKFRNKATGEVINSDPRLSMEALNERGLPGGKKVEMIRIV